MATPGLPSYRGRLLIAATLLASFGLHLYFSLMPDTMGDLRIFSVWAYQLERFGIAGAYFIHPYYPIDYPPGFLYVLRSVVWLHGLVDTSPLGPSSELQHWIRIPYAIADLLTAWLIYLSVKRVAPWRTAYWALVAYAFNPAVIFASAYWGVMDSMNVLLTILALVLLDHKKPELSWAAIAAAVLTKQFAAPVSLVIAVVTLRNYGWRRSLRCAGAALAVVVIMLAPLLAEHSPILTIERVLFDFGNMGYITVNAHNLWWIITGGPPWKDVSTALLGPLSYQSVGTALFCVLWAGCLAAIWWKKRDFQSRYMLTALITFGFFVVVTHMHENHLHTTIAILAIVACRDRRLAALYALVSTTLLVNMVLHDPYLVTEVLYGMPFDMQSMMSFTFAPAGQEMSATHLWLTFANAGMNVLLFCAFLYLVVSHFRRRAPGNAT